MKQIKLVLVLFMFLGGCGADTKSGGPKVNRGDPNRHLPTKKEKGSVIARKFTAMGINIQCPTDCVKDYEPSLQVLNGGYSDFQRRRGKVEQITLSNGDVGFDAKNKFVMMPTTITDAMVIDFFATQTNIERAQNMVRMQLSFTRDKFQAGVIQKALLTVAQNAKQLRPLSTKIQWIDFDGTTPGCQGGIWNIARDDFENRFDQSLTALQKCLGGK